MVLITNLDGKVAHQDAFSVKTPKNAQKTPFSYLQKGCLYEFRSPLVRFAIPIFYSGFRSQIEIMQLRWLKTAKSTKNRRKPPENATPERRSKKTPSETASLDEKRNPTVLFLMRKLINLTEC